MRKTLLLFVSADVNPFVKDTIDIISEHVGEEVEVHLISYFKPKLFQEIYTKFPVLLESLINSSKHILTSSKKNYIEEKIFKRYISCFFEHYRTSCIFHLIKTLTFLEDIIKKSSKGVYEKIHIHSFWLYPSGYAAVVYKKINPLLKQRIPEVSVSSTPMGFDIDINTLSNRYLTQISREVLLDSDKIIIEDIDYMRKDFRQLCDLKCIKNVSNKTILFKAFPPRIYFKQVEPYFRKIIVKASRGKIKTIIGFGPRLKKEYGAEIFIESLKVINKNIIRNSIFLITGSYEPLMLKKIRELDPDVKKRVKYLGFIPFRHMPAFYSSLDFFIFLHPVQGISVLESMASGKPVIGVEGGVNRIKHGITGFVLKKDEDPRKLAEYIEYLSSNPRETHLLGHNSYLYVKKYHNPYNSLRHFINYIDSVIK